ncbi:putative serine/threonine-protein kinase CTR1 [Monocercomonoides exilis]|uniref:putative serine/threonine-protein kinase CTR1 n=1 Tax=Monocercomonoides exilis TaxID=2049356 RepID=UPI00355A7896|nr:putative serine/threonine-protein kinase CTR1 [Monocercomonoides exilis]|eukprot:MONOS_6693.1-p1 / transcript=MONOS_6693.1 / gene=MONOS_6693 / organism=Monocercomonoides_exilis_PA203 / gene_product=serine / transcript_product=serine / location=Mono_scaffold00215:79353-81233(+) / protein_length=626 / sequence_SO=supercontig / SO=protein_coding / is_pseudo=false
MGCTSSKSATYSNKTSNKSQTRPSGSVAASQSPFRIADPSDFQAGEDKFDEKPNSSSKSSENGDKNETVVMTAGHSVAEYQIILTKLNTKESNLLEQQWRAKEDGYGSKWLESEIEKVRSQKRLIELKMEVAKKNEEEALRSTGEVPSSGRNTGMGLTRSYSTSTSRPRSMSVSNSSRLSTGKNTIQRSYSSSGMTAPQRRSAATSPLASQQRRSGLRSSSSIYDDDDDDDDKINQKDDSDDDLFNKNRRRRPNSSSFQDPREQSNPSTMVMFGSSSSSTPSSNEYNSPPHSREIPLKSEGKKFNVTPATKQQLMATERQLDDENLLVAWGDFSKVTLVKTTNNSKVYSAEWRGARVCLKRFDDAFTDTVELVKEIQVMESVRNDNVISLLGASLKPPFIVTPWMERGTLESVLASGTKLNWNTKYAFISSIANAVTFLHQQKPKPVFHADLRSSHILVDRNWTLHIGGFGCSLRMALHNQAKGDDDDEDEDDDDDDDTDSDDSSSSGRQPALVVLSKIAAVAPEVLTGTVKNRRYTDYYSFGVIAWEIAMSSVAYKGMKRADVMRRVVDEELRPPLRVERGVYVFEDAQIPSELGALIEAMWVTKPSERMRVDEAKRRLALMEPK